MSYAECSVVAVSSLDPDVSGGELVLGYDFYLLLAATRLLLAGKDPYEFCAYLGELNSLGRLASGAFPFPYPPSIFFLTAPFALLPPAIAVYVWTFIQCGVLWGTVVWVKRRLCLKSSLVLLFSFVLLFPGVIRHLYFGQVTLLILGLFLASFSLWERKKFFLSGLIITLALSKPHIAVLPLMVFASLVIRTGNFRWLNGVLAGVSIQTGVLLSSFPKVVPSFFKEFQEIVLQHQVLMNSIHASGPFPKSTFFLSVYILPVLALVSLIFLVVKRPFLSALDTLFLAIGLSLLLSPYLWLHDAVLLTPLYLALQGRLSSYSHNLMLLVVILLVVSWVSFGGFLLFSSYEWTLKIVSAGFVFTYWRVISSQCSAASRSSTSI